MIKKAIYPGTFDPITLGHIDIIKRSMHVVDKLVIGIARDNMKSTLFDDDERKALTVASLQESITNDLYNRIEVSLFDGLLMNYAHEIGATTVVRGLRAVSDFEYEFQLAAVNRQINEDIETVFLMAGDKYQFIASRFVREVARLGGDVQKFVTPCVLEALHKKHA